MQQPELDKLYYREYPLSTPHFGVVMLNAEKYAKLLSAIAKIIIDKDNSIQLKEA
jgi:hypothetical protein